MATGSIAALAEARFERLRALDVEASLARAELASNGVSVRRINILYPLDFTALLPGVIERLRPLAWDAYSQRYPSWEILNDHRARLINRLSPEGLKSLTDALCNRSAEEAARWKELIELLDSKYPQTINGLRSSFFYEIVDALYLACWLMENLPEVHSAQEALDYFLDVSGRLLLE